MTKKSHSTDQNKLKVLCDLMCDNIFDLLDYFDIDYKENGKMISMACPIHDGDNQSAVNIYHEGDTYRGNWKCRTHNCEECFKGSIIGFVRGVLSNRKKNWVKNGDDVVSFKEALDFCTKFVNKDLDDITICEATKNKKNFTNVINNISSDKQNNIPTISRDSIRSLLEIPSQYYINRGYSSDILNKYDVGLCNRPNKEMSGRVVVPIYDSNYKSMIGCSGRSIYNKCDKCGGFHNPADDCPSPENLWKYSKWKHNSGFKAQDHLYNFWFAKEHIAKSSYAILLESPGNVWKLEENGIHNSVAIFGTNLSAKQKLLLDSSGAMSLVIIMDNDEAGHKAAQNIIDKCNRTYNTYSLKVEKNDIGEMSTEEIQNQIVNQIKELPL